MQPHTDVTDTSLAAQPTAPTSDPHTATDPAPPTVPAPPVAISPTRQVRRNLREAVEDVFWELGGPDGMMKWTGESTANKRIFYKDILPKLIPKELRGELTGANGGPMKLVVAWEGDVPASAPAGAVLQAVTQFSAECLDADD